jgi:predicted RNase H-like HicB family nuclease
MGVVSSRAGAKEGRMAQVLMLVHEEGGRFGASFPDFPGCTTVARDLESLVAKAPEVLAFHVQGLVDEGREVPRVRSLSEMWADPTVKKDRRDAVYVTSLAVDLPGRSARINITMDEGLLDRIDRDAATRGETRSGWLARAAESRLPKNPNAAAEAHAALGRTIEEDKTAKHSRLRPGARARRVAQG